MEKTPGLFFLEKPGIWAFEACKHCGHSFESTKLKCKSAGGGPEWALMKNSGRWPFFFFRLVWGSKKHVKHMKYKISIHLKNVTSHVMWGLFHKAVYIRIPFKTTRRMTQRSASGWRNSKVKGSPKQRRGIQHIELKKTFTNRLFKARIPNS